MLYTALIIQPRYLTPYKFFTMNSSPNTRANSVYREALHNLLSFTSTSTTLNAIKQSYLHFQVYCWRTLYICSPILSPRNWFPLLFITHSYARKSGYKPYKLELLYACLFCSEVFQGQYEWERLKDVLTKPSSVKSASAPQNVVHVGWVSSYVWKTL